MDSIARESLTLLFRNTVVYEISLAWFAEARGHGGARLAQRRAAPDMLLALARLNVIPLVEVAL